MFREQVRRVAHRLDLERIAGRVEEEHRRLLAGLAGESDIGLDDELGAGGAQAPGQPLPFFHREHRAEMRDRDVVAVDRIVVAPRLAMRIEMGDDLMPEKVEIDPLRRAPPFRAAEQAAVKGARRVEVVDGKGEMEGREIGHERSHSRERGRAGGIAQRPPSGYKAAMILPEPPCLSGWRSVVWLLPLAALPLASCVAPAREAPPVQAVVRPVPIAGLEGVLGATARALAAQFGSAALDLREGNARKLQFVSAACVLDAYLYPPRAGAEPVVTHVDARLPDGREMDRASCVAALSAQQASR